MTATWPRVKVNNFLEERRPILNLMSREEETCSVYQMPLATYPIAGLFSPTYLASKPLWKTFNFEINATVIGTGEGAGLHVLQ